MISMPVASAGPVATTKYAYQHHEPGTVDMFPPVQNVWYTCLDADDCRFLWCYISQDNTGAVAKNMQVRWTIDGFVYYTAWLLASATATWIYRNWLPSAGGTQGLSLTTTRYNAAYELDKRGHSIKVEVRMTDAPGVAQRLFMRCEAETLEVT